jgi:hypothetical protein
MGHLLTSPVETWVSGVEGVHVMEPGDWARKALDIVESETRDLVHPGATSKSETDVEIEPLVEKIGATSIAEIEKMIGELQAAKDLLESEGERVQRETEHYTTLTQMASASVKIISDTVAGWREAGHPVRNHLRSPRSHAPPGRRERAVGAHAGSAARTVPATNPSPDPWEATP